MDKECSDLKLFSQVGLRLEKSEENELLRVFSKVKLRASKPKLKKKN